MYYVYRVPKLSNKEYIVDLPEFPPYEFRGLAAECAKDYWNNHYNAPYLNIIYAMTIEVMGKTFHVDVRHAMPEFIAMEQHDNTI